MWGFTPEMLQALPLPDHNHSASLHTQQLRKPQSVSAFEASRCHSTQTSETLAEPTCALAVGVGMGGALQTSQSSRLASSSPDTR